MRYPSLMVADNLPKERTDDEWDAIHDALGRVDRSKRFTWDEVQERLDAQRERVLTQRTDDA